MTLINRLVRHRRSSAGDVLLGLVDDAGYVRDRSAVSLGRSDALSDADLAVVLRVLSCSLDLRRRDVMRMCAVICRVGPVVWLPADVRWRTAVDVEAEFCGVRRGSTFLLTDAGWRDDAQDAGHQPSLPTPPASPWT